MPQILITGVAGFIGMHAAIRFINEGWDVLGVDNMNNYYSVELKEDRIKQIQKIATIREKQFDFRLIDLTSEEFSNLNYERVDAVLHLAAQAGVRYSIVNPDAYIHSNILGFQQVLNLMKKIGPIPFCYASSSSVYGKNSEQPSKESNNCSSPESHYAATKIANELMAYSFYKTNRIGSIGLRFFTVYGPWGRPDMAPLIFTNSAFNGDTIKVFNHGNQRRDFTYISDIINGIFALISNTGLYSTPRVLNIGKGSPDSLLDFIGLIEELSGIKLNKEFVDEQLGDVAETFASIDAIKDLVDFRPAIDLKVGLLNTIEWFKEYHKDDKKEI